MTLLALLVACDANVDSYVGDVPVTRDALDALHDPPDVTVDVQRVTVPAGGASCGHSPICLIVVPVVLVEAMFPERYDEVTVTTKGHVTWAGTFTTDGDLIQARVGEGDDARSLRRLDLEEIGQRVIVEVAHGDTPTPILPQVDLLAQYDANLRHADDPERRGRLLVEAWTWLGAESVAWVTEKLRDPAEPDEAKAAVLRAACGPPDAAGRAAFLDAVRAQPGPATAEAALACYSGDLAGADPFLWARAADLCTRDSDPLGYAEELGRYGTEHPDGDARARVWLAAGLATCPRASRRVLYQHLLDVPHNRREVARGLNDNAVVARVLDPDVDEERAGMVDALFSQKQLGGEIIARLAASSRAPDAREAEGIARAYVRSSFLEMTTEKRVNALGLLDRATSREQALAVLTTVTPAPFVDAARVVLGDVYRAQPAAKALDGRAPDDETGEAWVVVTALRLSGCDDAGILALAHAAKEDPEATGAGCAH